MRALLSVIQELPRKGRFALSGKILTNLLMMI